MKCAIIAIALALTVVTGAHAAPGRFRTIYLSEHESATVSVKYGRVTVLSFEEAIIERWNPLPKAFLDHLSAVKQDLIILPAVAQGETNFVVIVGKSRFHFTLKVVPETYAHDEVVTIKRVYPKKTPKKGR